MKHYNLFLNCYLTHNNKNSTTFYNLRWFVVNPVNLTIKYTNLIVIKSLKFRFQNKPIKTDEFNFYQSFTSLISISISCLYCNTPFDRTWGSYSVYKYYTDKQTLHVFWSKLKKKKKQLIRPGVSEEFHITDIVHFKKT